MLFQNLLQRLAKDAGAHPEKLRDLLKRVETRRHPSRQRRWNHRHRLTFYAGIYVDMLSLRLLLLRAMTFLTGESWARSAN
jgi:hypothetical protein